MKREIIISNYPVAAKTLAPGQTLTIERVKAGVHVTAIGMRANGSLVIEIEDGDAPIELRIRNQFDAPLSFEFAKV